MRPTWAASRWSWSLLLMLTACGGPDSNFDLDFTPVTAQNQTPFENVVAMELVLKEGSEEIDRFEMGAATSGDTPDVGKLPPLADTIISIEGLNQNGDVVAIGHSSPLTLTEGEQAYDMLFTNTDAFAWLSENTEAYWGLAGASDGRGNYFVFGGIADDFYGEMSDQVMRLQLAPAGSLVFEPVATLPEHSTLELSGGRARSHSSATLLTGSHDDAGKILVVGGWDSLGTFAAVTYQSMLFDPETLTFEEIDNSDALVYSRAEHGALVMSSGDVLIYGGSTTNQNGQIELYDADSRSFSVTEGSPTHDAWLAAGAPMGTNGALVCGGVALDLRTSTYGAGTALDNCYTIDIAGNANVASAMPNFLVMPAMAELPDGRVLLTGGATPPTNPFQALSTTGGATADTLQATNASWIYDPDTNAWTATGNMSVRRGGHSATTLADGRVLIVGGFSSITDLYFAPDDGIACAEVYDHRTGTFTPLDASCGIGSTSGALPGQTVQPLVISDPVYGTLVTSGLDSDLDAVSKAALFTARPR